jgi:tetratricopeptide (TPR) repeat protein
MKPALLMAISLLFSSNLMAWEKSYDYNRKGIEHGQKENLDNAIENFDRAIEIRDRASAILYHNKAYALEKKGNTSEAFKNYEEALKRNPKQIISGERCGHLYYKNEDWDNAIRIGELVLKHDPDNKKVPPWLEDARRRKKERDEELAIRKKKEAETAKKEEKKKWKLIYAGIEGTSRFGYYDGPREHWDFYATKHIVTKYISDQGWIAAFPYRLFVNVRPMPFLELSGTIQNPNLGAVSPDILKQQEFIEAKLKLGPAYLGIGFMFSHYDNAGWLSFYQLHRLNDYRLGIVLGFDGKESGMKIAAYPRYFIRDTSKTAGFSLDVVNVDLDYWYRIQPDVKFNSYVHVKDFFTVWHDLHLGNYWGTTDAGFGFTVEDIEKKADLPSWLELYISFEWIERFYFKGQWTRRIYTGVPNGQGWFGFDTHAWNKKNPMRNYYSVSQVISLKIEERLFEHFSFTQRFFVETVGKNESHTEFGTELGFSTAW